MIDQINEWIDQTLTTYSNQRVSCKHFSSEFEGFYPGEILSKSFYVVLNQVPIPDVPALHQMGFDYFNNMNIPGVTYKNTYFIKQGYEEDISIHFHELVHVLQWQYLGALPFIQRYFKEILTFGYQNASLEQMAYNLQKRFSMNEEPFNIPEYVRNHL